MKPVILGAVEYLNARPLVYGLELQPHHFTLRFDPPSRCAALLHGRSIDVGMIPTIEYLRGHHTYAIVPGVGIISDGAVASVALFSTRPLDRVRTIGTDTSSRTSHALLRVLCSESFGMDPEFRPMPPNPEEMLRRCDAALVIGDAALFFDHQRAGAEKVDLGAEWARLAGLPFVWAFWAGRLDALSPQHVHALRQARDRGVAASDQIAAAYCGPERTALCQTYLRDNIRYTLGEREEAGLRTYFELAEKHGLVEGLRPLVYY